MRVQDDCDHPSVLLTGGIERLWADARSGLRLLARRPGFAATAVPTLALGIGLNLAVFGFMSATLLRPPSVPDPRSLVRLFGTDDSRTFDVLSYANVADVAAGALAVALAAIAAAYWPARRAATLDAIQALRS